jgi:hypothetical protein
VTEYRTHEADSPYHRTLPIGDRLSGLPLVDDWLSCFDAVTLKVLEPMLVPEEPQAGMMEGRGAMLAFWDDVLPEMPAELQGQHLEIVAESLAAGGGTAFPNSQAGHSGG